MLKQLYVQQIDIQRMQNITRQLRDNQSMKNNSIPLSALTYNAPAGYAPLTIYNIYNKYIGLLKSEIHSIVESPLLSGIT